MVHRETEVRNKFTKSLGSGLGSLVNKGRTYYVLEHKTPSNNYPIGKKHEIITNYIELGRDPKCVIRFGEDVKTISRRHAAIAKEGNGWVIMNLSETNPTILNGRPVNKKWYLNNGDEIQLSSEGPRLGFIVPQNNTMGSLGLSKRLSLFRQQVLKPYRTAMIILSSVLVLVAAGAAFGITKLMQKNQDLEQQIIANKKAFEERSAIQESKVDSVKAEAKLQMDQMRKQLSGLARRRYAPPVYSPPAPGSYTTPNEGVQNVYGDVFFITGRNIKVSVPGEDDIEIENYVWYGTGFATTDGRFVTARHVVEPWSFPTADDELMIRLNALINTLDAEVTADLICVSAANRRYTLSPSDFHVDRSKDEKTSADLEGEEVIFIIATNSPYDFAWASFERNGQFSTAPDLSMNLQTGTQLEILGYPFQKGTADPNNLTPLYSTVTVAKDGLEEGQIMISDRNFDRGNSGGPVFFRKDGRYVVVGIVSGMIGSVGQIIPISYIY